MTISELQKAVATLPAECEITFGPAFRIGSLRGGSYAARDIKVSEASRVTFTLAPFESEFDTHTESFQIWELTGPYINFRNSKNESLLGLGPFDPA